MPQPSPLKILHVVPYYFPAWAYGGIPRIAYDISKEQARQGHEVTVATTDVLDANNRLPIEKGSANFEDYLQNIRKTIDGCTVYYFRNLSNVLAYRMQAFVPLGFKAWAKKNVRNFDVIHMHGHRHLLNSIAARCARKAGVPYVMTANGTAPAIERRFLLKKLFDPLFGTHVIKGAACFAAVSKFEISQYEALGIAREKISVIYNGLDLDEYASPPPKGTFRLENNLGEKKLILYLGKITPRKGIDVLIKAYAKLLADPASDVTAQNSRLVIAGNDMGFLPTLQAIAEKEGISDNILFTGLLANEEKYQCYVDCNVCVYPSTLEIFGLVPFESMMCDTPVIVSDDCGCGEIVKTAKAGKLVPYGDTDALKTAIHEVLHAHQDALAEEVARGKKFILANLGYEKIASQYVEMYNTAMRNNQTETAK